VAAENEEQEYSTSSDEERGNGRGPQSTRRRGAIREGSRLFIAVDLPAPIRHEVEAMCTGVNRAKWVKPHQLHITLRFLGQTPDEVMAAVVDQLGTVQVPSFSLALHGVGTFPEPGKRKRPRVLWLGLDPMGPLVQLKEAIDRALGPDPQGKATGYSPHLTLARFSESPDATLTHFLTRHQNHRSDGWQVSGFRLYRSTLHSSGATHEVVATYPHTQTGLVDQ
jgi:2'-5' RNA ligase